MDDKELLLLLEKLQSKTISATELKRLKSLIGTSDTSDELSKLMENIFEQTKSSAESLKDYGHEDIVRKRLEQYIPHTDGTSLRPSKRRNMMYWASALAAACIIVCFILFSQSRKEQPLEISWQIVSTKHGERKKISLSDGTSIMLNGNTTLAYPKHVLDNLRLVKLAGEAFFDVAKNEQKPFLVIAKDFTTQVVGTSFNIDSEIDKMVEVNTGQVNIYALQEGDIRALTEQSATESKSVLATIGKKSSHTQTLTKGQRAQLNDKHQWDVADYFYKNWLHNELIYLDEPLYKVLQKTYRNFGDSIAVEPNLAHKKITITFREKNKEQVLYTLAELVNGKLTRNYETNTWEITNY